jgi:polyisoprenoid-binding protein YceI
MAMTAAPPAISMWQIDPVHTSVEFALTHMPFSIFRGRFRDVAGEVTLDEAEPMNSSVTATIRTASVDVLGERFQGVVQGEEFLDTARWPEMTFQSARVERVNEATWNVTGALTIRDVTRDVTLVTRYGGQGTHPVSGRTLAGFHAETEIDRGDFGMRWNRFLDTGAPYLGTRVRITLDIEAVRQERAPS